MAAGTMTPSPTPLAYPPASKRNMALLVQLRWMAVVGQVVTIGFAGGILHIVLPLGSLLAIPAMLTLVNLATLTRGREREGYTHLELLGGLTVDMMALAMQLYFSGGATNPFCSLFLLQIVIGAILLPPKWSWIVAANCTVMVATLTAIHRPLILRTVVIGEPVSLYLLGNLISFALIASLLVFFVISIDYNHRQSETALSALRQQATEEHHIVRMGLLASGAAHELGTPMATMAVLVGDWLEHPAFRSDPELVGELQAMDGELQRCKSIISGILMSAGQARGENPTVTSASAFIQSISTEWTGRYPDAFHLRDRMDEDPVIVSDPALRQVMGNVIDNALEVSPDYVELTALLDQGLLVLEVRDRGPGFTQDMLETLGRPYSSTKGRVGGGLGLFLVVNVVRKLGGWVQVANSDHGGALVRISIPLRALAPAGGRGQ